MADRQDVYQNYLAALKYERFVAETYESLVSKKLAGFFFIAPIPASEAATLTTLTSQ